MLHHNGCHPPACSHSHSSLSPQVSYASRHRRRRRCTLAVTLVFNSIDTGNRPGLTRRRWRNMANSSVWPIFGAPLYISNYPLYNLHTPPTSIHRAGVDGVDGEFPVLFTCVAVNTRAQACSFCSILRVPQCVWQASAHCSTHPNALRTLPYGVAKDHCPQSTSTRMSSSSCLLY